MITRSDFETMCSDDFRADVERFIAELPAAVALKKGLANAALVASQVKYLQRARKKLPSYYGARAIIPSLSFEQSSSEQSASMRSLQGASALDLTCGLGVDTLYLSKNFAHVTAVERNEILCDVARHNFALMGADNVEVVCGSAEEFAEQSHEKYDIIFVDPDRRGGCGEKLYKLEDCTPNILAMMPKLLQITGRVVVKCSPLFDVAEALRLFEGCSVEAVSVGGECKEVVIEIGAGVKNEVRASVYGRGGIAFDAQRPKVVPLPVPENPRYLIVPDVALQKSRTAVDYYTAQGIAIESDNHYGFCSTKPSPELLGRVYEIESIAQLKDFARGGKATIMHRATEMTTEQIVKRLKIKQGGVRTVAVLTICGTMFAAELKNC